MKSEFDFEDKPHSGKPQGFRSDDLQAVLGDDPL